MTDDEILLLWTLAGSPYWHPDLLKLDRDFGQMLLYHHKLEPFCLGIVNDWYKGAAAVYLTVDIDSIIYKIEDIITFCPSERWLKLLLARHWYQQNREQFE